MTLVRLVGSIEDHRLAKLAEIDREFERVAAEYHGSPVVQAARTIKTVEAAAFITSGDISRAPSIKLEAAMNDETPKERAEKIVRNANLARQRLFEMEMRRMQLKRRARLARTDLELQQIQVSY